MKTFAATTLIVSGLLSPFASAVANPVLVGIPDDFQDGPEALSPSPALSASLAGSGGCQDLDLVAGIGAGVNNRQVAHTFTDLPNGIVQAWLETKVRAGNDAGVASDGIFLSWVDETTVFYSDALAWRRSFGPVAAIPPYYPEDDPGLLDEWNAGDEATLVLPLHALPLPDGSIVDITPLLSQQGFLDVNVSDETGADYFRLTWEVGATGAPWIASSTAGSASGQVRCYPNPCRGADAISFVAELAALEGASARWRVYDVAGRLVQAIDGATGPAADGLRQDWTTVDSAGRPLAPGTYFVRYETTRRSGSAKFVIVR